MDMRGLDGLRGWMPVIVTGGLFVVVVGGVALLASATLADLVGLIYLLASPAVYRGLRAIADAESGVAGLATGTTG